MGRTLKWKKGLLAALLASAVMGPTTLASAELDYLSGFGNEFASEALEGALPVGQNTPQRCPYGLYAEQLSGTSFTTPRVNNKRLWLYRIRPSVLHSEYERVQGHRIVGDFSKAEVTPNQLMWQPLALPGEPTDFVQGLVTLAGAGSAESKAGIAIHQYVANCSMVDSAFCSADGDLLFVPQQGEMLLQTECGNLEVSPGEIAVIPRGMRFRVEAVAGVLRGYICETFDGHLELPNLGPIGANGLANPRDFQVPTASFEDKEAPYTIYTKFCGELFRSHMAHSPFDVVAFHGNDVPYKYDLARFCPMNSVSYDHADPSIFTVLTCQTALPGVAALDFVVFPPRWSTAEHTFRPPYYHRNCMSEYMGLVFGNYEGKGEGLKPGGSTLHSCMTPHGPDAAAYEYGSNEALVPKRVGEGALAFMFESTYVLRLTPYAMDPQRLVASYRDCWKGLSSHFEPGEGAVAQGD